MDDLHLSQLQQTLASQIPITSAMGIEVVSWDGHSLSMRMPLEVNRNHQYSAFAGSLNALCTVVGWGTVFLYLLQKSLSRNIVIRRGTIRYLRPLRTGEIVARGVPLDPDELDYFLQLLESKGKSKVNIAAEIADDAGPFVTFKGSYVVLE
ncbi:MAG: YiiD C-terminal domain-containing protein [Pirellulales bacterium]